MFYRVAISVLIFTMLLPWFTPAFSASASCSECVGGVCLLEDVPTPRSGVCAMHSAGRDSHGHADDAHAIEPETGHEIDAEQMAGTEMDGHADMSHEKASHIKADTSHGKASHEKTSHIKTASHDSAVATASSASAASSASSNDRCRAVTSISCATNGSGSGLEEIAPSEPHLLLFFTPTESAERELHRALLSLGAFISSDPTAIDRPPNNPIV